MIPNFDVVVPYGPGFAHFYRDATVAWHGPTESFGSIGSGPNVGGVLDMNISLNLELVANAGGSLVHYWQDASGWHGGPIAVGNRVPVGSPAFSAALGQIVVPVAPNGALAQFSRPPANEVTSGWLYQLAGSRKLSGFGAGFDSAVLIQSTFGHPANDPFGNWELVAHQQDHLVHFWYDSGGWHQGETFAQGAAGRPGFIQGTAGSEPNPNFEVVVPMGNALAHFYRDNSAPGYPWVGPTATFAGPASAVALAETSFGNLELIYSGASATLSHWYSAPEVDNWTWGAQIAEGQRGAPGFGQFGTSIG